MTKSSTGPVAQLARAQQIAAENGRVCPMPPVWARFYSLLLGNSARGDDPTLKDPLILGAWFDSSNTDKAARLNEQLIWACRNEKGGEAVAFLELMSDGDWLLADN